MDREFAGVATRLKTARAEAAADAVATELKPAEHRRTRLSRDEVAGRIKVLHEMLKADGTEKHAAAAQVSIQYTATLHKILHLVLHTSVCVMLV